MMPTLTLTQAFQFLYNAAPEQYEAAVGVFHAYMVEALTAVTDAPQDQILVMQGRAQQCRALHRMLTEVTTKPKPKPAPSS